MSRYQIPTYQPEKYQAHVGFDLAGHTSYWTFFGQIIDLAVQNQLKNLNLTQPNSDLLEMELEEKKMVLWVGSDYQNPIRRLDELQKQLAPYCFIPTEILQQLSNDQEQELQQPKFKSSDWLEDVFNSIFNK